MHLISQTNMDPQDPGDRRVSETLCGYLPSSFNRSFTAETSIGW